MAPDARALAQTIPLSATPAVTRVATHIHHAVLPGRLAAAVAPSRVRLARVPETEGEEHGRVVAELRAADRRMRVINNSILAAVACGIVVCLLVALLFTQAFTGLNLGVAASWAFALAMLLLRVSLLLFLLEVRLAIRAIQVPMDQIGRATV